MNEFRWLVSNLISPSTMEKTRALKTRYAMPKAELNKVEARALSINSTELI